jgi:hypothetical protein
MDYNKEMITHLHFSVALGHGSRKFADNWEGLE